MERLTKGIGLLDLESPKDYRNDENLEENAEETPETGSLNSGTEDMVNGTAEFCQSSLKDSSPERVGDDGSHDHLDHQILDGDFNLMNSSVSGNIVVPIDPESEMTGSKIESCAANAGVCDADDFTTNKPAFERRLPNAVLPLLRYYQYESSESSSRYNIVFFCAFY